MRGNNTTLLENDVTKERKSFTRKSRVKIHSVSTSPRTLKLMEENERFLDKYEKKRKIGIVHR